MPQVDWELERNMIYAVIDAIHAGHVAACTDISDGGLAVALSEMAIGGFGHGKLGAELDLAPALNGLRVDRALFSETGGFVAEVCHGQEGRFEAIVRAHGLEPIRLGVTSDVRRLTIAAGEEELMSTSIDAMAAAWQGGLARLLR